MLTIHKYDDILTLSGHRSTDAEPGACTLRDVIEREAPALGSLGADVLTIDGRPVGPGDLDQPADSAREIVLAPGYGDPGTVGLLALGIALSAASALVSTRQRVAAPARQDRERRFRFGRFTPPARAGDTKPVVFGEHKRLGGFEVFQAPGEGPDGDGLARVLITYGHGPFAQIGDQTADADALAHDQVSGIYINDQPISQFPGARVWVRMGGQGQAPIPGFDDALAVREVGSGGVALENTDGADRGGADGASGDASAEAHITTTSGDVDAVIVRIEFSRGLYEIGGSGQINSRRAGYRVRIRLADDGGSPGAWSAWTVTFVERAEQSAITSALRIDLPSRDTYDVQAERITREESAGQFIDDMLWTDIVEVTDTNSTYDGHAMLAVELVADERLSAVPDVTAEVKGYAAMRVWDGVSGYQSPVFNTGYSDNPWAIALEMQTNAVFGFGARNPSDLSSVDLASLFDEWAYADEMVDRPGGGQRKRYRCAFVLDTPRDEADTLALILATARGGAAPVGDRWRYHSDRPRPATEVFGDDSIMAGDDGVAMISFRRELTTGGHRPNQLTGTFNNEQKDGREDTVTFPADGTQWLGAPLNEPRNTQQADLTGITDPDQAASELVYRLKRIRFLSGTVRFTPSLPIVRTQPGNRFDLSSSLALIGLASGFLETESTAGAVQLDATVELEDGESYTLDVVHPDGTSEQRAVSSGAGVYAGGPSGDTISLTTPLATAPSTDPANPTRYAIGKTGIVRKPYTCQLVALQDTEGLRWEIEGIEYDIGVYDDTAAEVDSPEYTAPQGAMTAPGPVQRLRAVERITTIDGQSRRRVELSWRQAPEDARITAGYRVYRRREGTGHWILTPTVSVSTSGAAVELTDLDRSYQFTVIGFSVSGAALSPNDPSVPVTGLVFGLTAEPPAAPGAGTVTRNVDGTYKLAWNPVAGVSGYQVLVGGSPGTGLPNDGAEDCLVLARTTDPELDGLTLAPGLDGSQRTFWVRSVGENGRLSITALRLDATGIIAPPGESVVASPAWDLSIDGTADGLAWDAADAVLRTDSASVPGTWTSPEIDLVTEATRRLAARMLTGNDWQDALVRTDFLTVPSIPADQWGVVSSDGTPGGSLVGMVMPPHPDTAQAWALEARIFAGGAWGDWQPLGHAGGIVAAMERAQIRVTLSRPEAPYRPAIRTTGGVRAVVME